MPPPPPPPPPPILDPYSFLSPKPAWSLSRRISLTISFACWTQTEKTQINQFCSQERGKQASSECFTRYLHFVRVSNDAQRFVNVGWLRSILNKNHLNASSLLRIIYKGGFFSLLTQVTPLFTMSTGSFQISRW